MMVSQAPACVKRTRSARTSAKLSQVRLLDDLSIEIIDIIVASAGLLCLDQLVATCKMLHAVTRKPIVHAMVVLPSGTAVPADFCGSPLSGLSLGLRCLAKAGHAEAAFRLGVYSLYDPSVQCNSLNMAEAAGLLRTGPSQPCFAHPIHSLCCCLVVSRV